MQKPATAYRGDEPFVFVCYSHDDADTVYPEIAWLQSQGVNVWYDEGISAGRVWRAEIAQALDACSTVLYYVSPRSLDSAHCNREINFALDQDKEILPVYLENVALTDDLKVGLSRVQALHRDSDERYQRHLLSALRVDPDLAETSTPGGSRPRYLLRLAAAACFVVPISAAWWFADRNSIPADSVSIPVIAVLPFENLGSTEDYFGEGVAEEILNRMVRFEDVRVISRHSSFALADTVQDIREVGEHLGARYVLQGSVRRNGGTVRVAVHLTDTSSGTEIWANSYDRGLSDMLRVQDEIAQLAIGELLPSIVVTPSTQHSVDPVAYELYLKARVALSANDASSAMTLLQSAVTLDDEFSDAYTALADTHESLRIFGAPYFVGDAELREVLDRALELDPTNPEALAVAAKLDFYVNSDLSTAVSKFERLLATSSSTRVIHHYRPLLAAVGKLDDLVLVAERRRELDPHSRITAITSVFAYMAVGEFDKAREAANRLPLAPVSTDGDWTGRRPWLIHIDLADDQLERAAENMDALGTGFPEEGRLYFRLWLAIERGDLAAARELYAANPISINAMPFMTWLPFDAALTGEVERTLDEIERPTEARSIVWITQLAYRDRWASKYAAPAFRDAFDALRAEPGYQEALARYGIDADSLANIPLHTAQLLKR